MEESLLRELVESTYKNAHAEGYKRGWIDAALGTRAVSERVCGRDRELLMAVADSLQETADALPSSLTTQKGVEL